MVGTTRRLVREAAITVVVSGLAVGCAADLEQSPRPAKIVFAGDRYSIFGMNLDGTGVAQIGDGDCPSFAPDGSKIVVGGCHHPDNSGGSGEQDLRTIRGEYETIRRGLAVRVLGRDTTGRIGARVELLQPAAIGIHHGDGTTTSERDPGAIVRERGASVPTVCEFPDITDRG